MEIIKLEQNSKGEIFSTSLEIARVTEKKHYHVTRDIKEELQAPNLVTAKYKADNNKELDYYILDEYQTLQVMSRYSREVRTMVINEFKRMKEYIKANQQPNELSLEEMTLKVITGQQEKIKQLETRNKQVTDVLTTMQTYGDNLLFREFVKVVYSENGITISEKEFRRMLKEQKYINDKCYPYAKYKKYFKVNKGVKGGKAWTTTRLTARGQLYFTNKLIQMFEVE